MNYFWSFLFITISVNAAYNPFFKPLVKQKRAPVSAALVAPASRAMPLPPLLKPAFESTLAVPKPSFDLSQLIYNCFLETAKGKFILLNIGEKSVVLKEGDPFYVNNSKYFIRNITSNFITVDDSGRTQTVYFSAGGGR